MPFVISSRPSYFWPVVYHRPVDGGKFQKHTFDVEFKYMAQSEVKKWLESEDKTDNDFAKAIVIGWKGVQEEGGEELPFSESALEKILDLPSFAKCITSAYLKSISEASAKN